MRAGQMFETPLAPSALQHSVIGHLQLRFGYSMEPSPLRTTSEGDGVTEMAHGPTAHFECWHSLFVAPCEAITYPWFFYVVPELGTGTIMSLSFAEPKAPVHKRCMSTVRRPLIPSALQHSVLEIWSCLGT